MEPLPQQAEWSPFPLPSDDEKIDFTDGLHTLCGSGDPNLRQGIALYVYMLNTSMEGKAYCNTDGDFLITPQLGSLDIQTEMGRLYVQPGEICVIQRGIRFKIGLDAGTKAARGHVAEVWGSVWELPDLGPLGGYGLANPRDFLYPVAHIDEELHKPFSIVVKNSGKHFAIQQDHSPFDVVAWHGNCVPYKVSEIPNQPFLNYSIFQGQGGLYTSQLSVISYANFVFVKTVRLNKIRGTEQRHC